LLAVLGLLPDAVVVRLIRVGTSAHPTGDVIGKFKHTP